MEIFAAGGYRGTFSVDCLATPFFRSGEKPYRLTVYCCTAIPRRHSFPVTVIKHFDYYSALFLDSPVLFFPSFFRTWGTSAALGGVGGNLGTCPFKNAIWSILNQNSPFWFHFKEVFWRNYNFLQPLNVGDKCFLAFSIWVLFHGLLPLWLMVHWCTL